MAKAIMIQGTMSNAGKSLFTAALCRIMKQDGFRVAPFKSQNMALNSFITKDGFEMGRAQAMQAEAAGVDPSVHMNPILLKPTSNIGSQVILNGKPLGNIKAADYFKNKSSLVDDIMKAYNTLCCKYDIIVIEGAGSPVELNLKKNDIVNMGMAKLARSPVLLVGDIDRGGIFPQLLGTLSLLEDDERDMIKGLVVNKFRGDISLFDDGIKILEERGKKRVLGVVPYINCDIDDEDSLSDKLSDTEPGLIDIAVIKLPRISNFTDFDAFSQYEGVKVRYVSNSNQLKKPDLIILPGTKSTIADLIWLREGGLEAAIKKCVCNETALIGICGGYQMLGKKIKDSEGVEYSSGEIDGIGLLDIETEFKAEKIRTRVKGVIEGCEGFFAELNGREFEGYEIHMGVTTVKGKPFARLNNGKLDGAFCKNVFGSYVHGIFDLKEISEKIIELLYKEKGLEYKGISLDRQSYKEIQYNLLADEVRKSIDMKLVYKIIEEGI